jgi:EmrB/QacA subfamily drug resistance transporter
LIGFRVLQSVGAAMVLALGVAIVTETWPGSERGKAIGVTGSVISFGIVVGPTIGGFLLAWLHWRWIFYVNVPVGIVALVLIWLYVPDLKPSGRRERFDWLGALMLGVGLLAFTLALTLGQYNGFTAPVVLLLFGVAVVAILLFLWVERRVRYPMVDMSLFRVPQFSLNLFTGWLTFVAIAGVVLLLPFYLELVMGLPLQRVGLMMALPPVLLALLQPFTGALSDRLGTRPVTVVGLAILAVGYVAMSTIQVESSALGYILRLAPVSLGMATFQSPNNSAIMGSVPRPRLGVASGILSMVRTLGQVVGIAVLGAFFAWRLTVYGGAGVQIRTAAPEAIVRAIHDQFLLVAGLIVIGFLIAVWTWHRERVAARTAGSVTPAVAAQGPGASYDSNTGS